MNIEDYFSVQIFFIILRETLESAIIISVLLSFLKQNFTYTNAQTNEINYSIPKSQYNSLKLQIWIGGILGLAICFVIGGVFILVFYLVGDDLWSLTERLWEGIFSILSCLVISVMGLSLLRINNLTKKWKFKLSGLLKSRELRTTSASSISNKIARFNEKYSLLLLPFITTLREGLEAVVFIGGIGASAPLSSMPLAIFLGAFVGSMIGVTLYKSGNKLSLNYFLIFSTCFLYLIASGLMSRGVWFLELERFVRRCGGIDPSEVGSGPGSYDIANSVWHVNCCNGLTDNYWMLLNAIFGWTNSATYGSIISYNIYWVVLILVLKAKIHQEKTGLLPYVPIKWQLLKIKKRVMMYDSLDDNQVLLAPHLVNEGFEREDEFLGESEGDALLPGSAAPVVGESHEQVIERT